MLDIKNQRILSISANLAAKSETTRYETTLMGDFVIRWESGAL